MWSEIPLIAYLRYFAVILCWFADALLLGNVRNVVGNTLPASGNLDPGIRPSILTTDLLALHHPFLSGAASDYRRVAVNADLHFIIYRGRNHPLSRLHD